MITELNNVVLTCKVCGGIMSHPMEHAVECDNDPYIEHCKRVENGPEYARYCTWALYTQGNGVFYA